VITSKASYLLNLIICFALRIGVGCLKIKNVAALDGGGSGDVNPRKPTGVSSAASVNKIVSQNEGIINLSA
jgi:hypothetical protein